MGRGVSKAALGLLTALALTGCDVGDEPADESIGPDLHVISTFPENGAGTDCAADAGDDCGVPGDTPVELRVDRFLLPKTATRQALRVYSATRDQPLFLAPTYDVVERVVTFRPAYGAAFVPGLLYVAELVLPREDKNGFGLRAFDGAPLVANGSAPVRFSFRVARRPPKFDTVPAPEPTCRDALDAFERTGCTSCHAGEAPPVALGLDSQEALRLSAVSRPSHEVEGPNVNSVLVDPAHFGVGMAVVEPGSPSRSYLLYKLLVNPENFGAGDGDCVTTHQVALPPGVCIRPTEAERRRLQDWFVRMDPMPPSGGLARGVADLRFFADFVRAGADTASCD